MNFLGILLSVFAIISIFIFYQSYYVQFLLNSFKVNNHFLRHFTHTVKGSYVRKGYFTSHNKVILDREYKRLGKKERLNYSKCFNIVKFQLENTKCELFFYLIKEGLSYTQVLNLRVFIPHEHLIKSEGNVEKNYGRVNIFTNNHYLTRILETKGQDCLNWLIRYNGDILFISSNNLHFKAFNTGGKMSLSRSMDILKAVNVLRKEIYSKDVMEY